LFGKLITLIPKDEKYLKRKEHTWKNNVVGGKDTWV
jgi:hypothetical protein